MKVPRRAFLAPFPLLLLARCHPAVSPPAVSASAAQAEAPRTGKGPADFVDPFIGTGGDGHTYPGATVPFGMVQLSPDTDVRSFKDGYKWAAGYRYSDSTIAGFSHTHFSGTGHSDLGDILVMPTMGPLQLDPGAPDAPDSGYRSRFSHESESASPGYYAVTLQDSKIKVELAATNRVGFHRYTFTQAGTAHVVLDLVSSIYDYDGKVLWSEVRVENDSTVTGSRETDGWAPGRKLSFALQFSKPFTAYGLRNEADEKYRGFGKSGRAHVENYPELHGRKLKGYFDFPVRAGEVLEVKVALSPVDAAGAQKNMAVEAPGWDFDAVRAAARDTWNRELSKIDVTADDVPRRIFYTALYHSMLAPVTYMDEDGRYRGVDHALHTALGFTNYHVFSLWDTFRAEHPLLALLEPRRDGDMIRSMLAHRRESVHHILPIWSFGSAETWCMIGYHSVSVIADGYLKGIGGFDPEEAFAAMKASATYAPYDGLGDYEKLGYVPVDREPEAASKTLEYAYDDWTIARMASALGHKEDTAVFEKRAASFNQLFDPATGFMRAKKEDGRFREPFDPLYAQYGSDYTEGNAWQYTWFVPHDVQRLITLMGGRAAFVSSLDRLFALKADDPKYNQVEDISGLIGQYAHGNEPSQHIAYLYSYAGQPWRTQERIHQILTTLYDATPAGIPGNEDCGQMSAWYVFSALGFYPVCPGSLEYVIGRPSLPRADIHLPSGQMFTVIAENLSEQNLYIQSATLRGEPYEKAYLRHEDLVRGGTLTFVMGPRPNPAWASGPKSAPYSMSQ